MEQGSSIYFAYILIIVVEFLLDIKERLFHSFIANDATNDYVGPEEDCDANSQYDFDERRLDFH